MKKKNRKAELRRLAAKRGWEDGFLGIKGASPTKTVMAPSGRAEVRLVPIDEESAYWCGYAEGEVNRLSNRSDAKNPYTTNKT